MRKVSVEGGLDSIQKCLEERGYEVVPMENCLYPVEAVVYYGGEQTTSRCSHSPDSTILINAQGLTPDAVIERLESL